MDTRTSAHDDPAAIKPDEPYIVDWDSYRPAVEMQTIVDMINDRTVDELAEAMPAPVVYKGDRATFSYRIYSDHDLAQVEKVYVILGGFAERANSLDSGLKGLMIDLLLNRFETTRYAVVTVGGLFSFAIKERDRLLKQGSGALSVASEDIASLLASQFPALKTVTASGYSMGGTLAPLVAQAVVKRKIATVDQVNCGEPTYSSSSTTRRDLLKRTARSSLYRNEQILASLMKPYIAIKTTPSSLPAMAWYRFMIYRPLLRRILSMRLVVQDLALQAMDYDPASYDVQAQEALRYLAKQRVRINVLHAEHSVICQGDAFYQLVDELRRTAGPDLRLTIIKGIRADHGIEEHRSLSTPFLVKPELYHRSTLASVE